MDTGNCQRCGVTRPWLHRHHIVMRSIGGTDADGIELICANCHEDEHGGPCGGVSRGRSSVTPEANAKRSESMKRAWQDPLNRERWLGSPARVALARGGAKASADYYASRTPEQKAYQIERVREGAARRFAALRERDGRIMEYTRSGWSVGKIADKLGLPPSTVSQIQKRRRRDERRNQARQAD